MAELHIVAGPVLVKYNGENIGYTRDGVQVTIEEFSFDVKSDDWGGQDGAPADQQMLGSRARISCELTKYDAANVRALTSFQPGGTAGQYPNFGTLKRQGSQTATLLLDGVNEDWTFATAIVVSSHEFNTGTKFTTWRCNFEAWNNQPSIDGTPVLFTYA